MNFLESIIHFFILNYEFFSFLLFYYEFILSSLHLSFVSLSIEMLEAMYVCMYVCLRVKKTRPKREHTVQSAFARR